MIGTAVPPATSPETPPTAPVEFLGWLPVFQRFGNCGAHPQFAHTAAPPPGYRFTRSTALPAELPALPKPIRAVGAVLLSLSVLLGTARRCGMWRTLRALWDFARFALTMTRASGRLGAALQFAHSRHLQSQALSPDCELAFLTSVPYTFGQRPWVIEIEDPTRCSTPSY